ncbi:hypothetical protein VTK56DRAFT_5493 [Thermocarpiscus australiensis]
MEPIHRSSCCGDAEKLPSGAAELDATDSSSLPEDDGRGKEGRESGEAGAPIRTSTHRSDTEGTPEGIRVSRQGTRGDGAEGGVISRVVSRVISNRGSVKFDPGPPPDGGAKAWTAVACAHLVIMNTWGMIGSFGLFQTYYATALGRPPSDISWIGSVQIFLLFFIGTLTGRLTDAGYFRHVFALGVVFQLVGIFTTSAATKYWQVLLAQGICMGIGNGCLFCPCISIVSTYFDKKRGIALALGACGTATGGLVFPGMVRQLLPAQGFAAAMRAIGYIQVGTFAVALLFLKPRIPPRKSGPLVEWAAFKEGEYTFYALGSFSFFLGLYFAFYYVSSFSRDIIGMSYTDSLNLLLVVNAAGIPGRLILNKIGDRMGPLNVMVPVTASTGICMVCWMAVRSTAGMYVWTCFYGLFGGGIQSLFPAALSSLTTDLSKAGVRIGMTFTIVSFATLAGPPIAGAIITASGGRYYGAQAFAAATLLLGMGFMTAARTVKARRVKSSGAKAGAGWHIKV